jgi:Domain of unknown function (DUF4439)
MTTPAPSARLAALQAALAGEHAAVWAAGRAAAELTGSRRRAALTELDRHRDARDRLRGTVASLGAAPAEAAPAYLEPFPVEGRAAARRLMAHVNSGLAAAYADVAAASPPAGRRPAAIACADAAVRAIDWGADAQAQPGES